MRKDEIYMSQNYNCKCQICLEAWANAPHYWGIGSDTVGPFTAGEIEAYWRWRRLRGGTARTPRALDQPGPAAKPTLLRRLAEWAAARDIISPPA